MHQDSSILIAVIAATRAPSPLGMVRFLAGFFIGFLFCFGQSSLAQDAASMRECPEERELVDINQASREELMQLSGVGPVLADRILAFRANWGDFPVPQALVEVPGIGARLLERNMACLVASQLGDSVP